MNVDPFDIQWIESDPLDRDVAMLQSVIDAREFAGKHASSEEFLSPDDVRSLIASPDRIDESVSDANRDLFYKGQAEYTNPYARAVVDYSTCDDYGIVISWSRYKQPVSSYGVKWKKEL